MPYTPKTQAEVLRDLRALVIGRTSVNDIQPGSVLNTLLGAFAHEVASIERRIYNVREGFFLEKATGTDLDERVAELPLSSLARLPSTNGSATCLTITRSSSAGDLTIPAGSLVATEGGVQYRTTDDAIITDGDLEVEDVNIVAVVSGSQGNTAIGTITKIVALPDDVISVTNSKAISNAGDTESDAQLRERAQTYLKSLSRCSPSTLEFLAKSFISSNGDRMRFARIYENPERPAVSELVVDDGSGITVANVSKVGGTSTGTIPSNGYRVLYHEAPATAPITTNELTILRGSSPVSLTASDITSIHERGIVYIRDGILQAGDTWTITGHRVYTGLIAELQKEIEGDVDNPSVLTGFRASGCRCIVKVADAQYVVFTIFVTVAEGYVFENIVSAVRTAIGEFINNLAPSEPLYISSLVAVCKEIEGLQDVKFYTTDATPQRLDNIFPSSPTTALRVNASSISITQSES